MEYQFRLTKAAVSAGLLAVLPLGDAVAQTRVSEHHHIASGTQFGVPTDSYFARTPYTIIWKADKSGQLFVQEGRVRKLNEVTVEVYDDASKKLITTSGWSTLNGELKVPVGGKHHLRVYAPGRWTADFKEDKEMLLKAASRGELKDGVTVEEASANSLRTKKERMDAFKERLLKKIESSREEYGTEGTAALIADVHRAAQLASDEIDCAKRFAALGTETMIRIRAEAAKAGGKAPSAVPPIPVATPGSANPSGWTGKGLPPGMQRR